MKTVNQLAKLFGKNKKTVEQYWRQGKRHANISGSKGDYLSVLRMTVDMLDEHGKWTVPKLDKPIKYGEIQMSLSHTSPTMAFFLVAGSDAVVMIPLTGLLFLEG